MAHYQFDSNSLDTPGKVESIANTTIAALVRLAGLALLAVGLWTAITILNEAWAIYTNPKHARIESFARAIDDATHIDVLLAPQHPASAAGSGAGAEGSAIAKKAEAPASSGATETFRLSYFIAWAILLMMLLLVGRLAMAAITTGGQLALYDVQIRRFARELMREAARERGRS
jgi:hypothetical protein